ncbi:T9SS type A sorting domain-containing protein [Dyadobacter psychrophilus]|uniref:Por secretion system C-terminal sorting domain-containing protein n=1 Tax=Dyadobacter psychrophilus TaxID=651661 RepID=A0A1T5GK16_9BACT|nr:T9SS type A sorting domain-containing protein [Dyadobacter psychrophilus]SKC08729.1 Por secretion system C-terminal sorting domain-containing protein [Dyadobacter psychrophilus]
MNLTFKRSSLLFALILFANMLRAQTIDLQFQNTSLSPDGLTYKFDVWAFQGQGYNTANPDESNWQGMNIRADINVPAGVTITTATIARNFTYTSLGGVSFPAPGDVVVDKNSFSINLLRDEDQSDIPAGTGCMLGTVTINFSGAVPASNTITVRPFDISELQGAYTSFWANLDGSVIRRIFQTFPVGQSLPVNLTSFDLNTEGSAVNLIWATTTETNSDRFDVQRSSDGKEWSIIQSVLAKGESNSKAEYSAIDANPIDGDNLYRLHMIDKDGTSAYSRVRSVKFEGVATYMYPNPVSEELIIKAADWTKVANVQIIAANGKAIYQSSGKPSPNVNVKNLLNGIYLVRLTNTNGSETTHKIVVNN